VGAIGSGIDHELTHGFDDQGRQFAWDGNLKDWWTAEDAKKLEERSACLVDQSNGYTAVADVKLNGKLTLGENVADAGGVRIAYMALMDLLTGKERLLVDGFTPEQRFFLGWAQVWCENLQGRCAHGPREPLSGLVGHFIREPRPEPHVVEGGRLPAAFGERQLALVVSFANSKGARNPKFLTCRKRPS